MAHAPRTWLRTVLAALVATFVQPGRPYAQPAQTPLTHLQFDIIGVRLVVDPPALTVPKNIATQINTTLQLPPGIGSDARDAILALTDGAQVEGELRGPSLQPTRIAVVPGQPIPIPPLAVPGDYFLDGIRLEKDGQTVLDATTTDGKPATTIAIRVINEVLVSSVTSQPLSLDDIRSKGIVIDENNFSAVNFQVAFNIDGTPFTISAPAVLPTPQLLQTQPDRTTLIQQISALNQQLSAKLTTLPPQFDRPGLNFSIAALPFFPVLDDSGDKGFDTPPVTGLIVIPGNVAFLNQFFSAMLLVANAAPGGTPLELHDVKATISLPKGLDGVAGTYDAPGDDPLRLARLDGGVVQPTIPVAQRGPDGQLGTADDIFVIPAQKQGEGEFLIEGLKEGSQSFNIAIAATLFGLPQGPVNLQGQAAGAVFVRNPTFAVTLAHPRTVRSGEPYSIYATVTNTSKTTANLVSVNLAPGSITGAQLLSDPTVTFDSIAPGQSVIAKYSLNAQITGQVTFSSFTGDAALGGGIQLETGVDERDVPLSANAIVLPESTDFLPSTLVAAAERVLGQAFSVATAPADALPDGVLFVKRQTVIDRGTELAEAGERVKFGEPLSSVLQDLLLDWLGNTTFDDGFDQIMRTTDAGADVLDQFAAAIGPDVAGDGALEYQRRFAQATVVRAGHLSAIAAGPAGAAPLLTVEAAAGGSLGLDLEGNPVDSLLSGALLTPAGASSRFAVVAAPQPDSYRIEIEAPAAGQFDLGVVVPTGQPGQLRQLRFPGVTLDQGGRASVVVDLTGSSNVQLSIDRDGDGGVDSTLAADIVDIAAGPPQLVAVRQLESSSMDNASVFSDPAAYGLLVAALFDTPVTEASAETVSNYGIASNAVIGAQLQHSGRLVYLYLQKPIGGLTPRSLSVNGVMDARGDPVAGATLPITTILTNGAHVFGQVRDAGGAAVGGGLLKLTFFSAFSDSFDVSVIATDASGGFDFDFVPQIGDHFTLTAQHPVTRDLATITARVRGAGEQMLLDPTFLGRATVHGKVIGPDGVTPVANIPIALIPGSVVGPRGFQGSTNGLGDFTFTDVPVGVFTLSASDGLGDFGQADGVIAQAGDTVTANLQLVTQPADGGHLIGRVFLSDGTTPASNFTVYVGSFKRDNGTMAAVGQTTTDNTGSFSFALALSPQVYDVVAVDPATGQLGTAQASVAARTTSSVSIVLEAVGAVEGVVFDGRGQRVPGAVVAGGVALVTADANGFFHIDGVPAGSRTIDAGDPVSHRRGSAIVTVLPGQTVSAAITLESRATITGRVLDANGQPVPGASVRIPEVGGYEFVIANSQGVFTFPDRPLGTYLIQAPGPSKESLISFMQANGYDPASAFTSGDAPDSGSGGLPSASDTNAVLAAYQSAVQTFFSVPDTLLSALPMASLSGYGWNKVTLAQDGLTVVADIKFLQQGTVSGTTVDSAGRPTGATVRISSLTVTGTGAPGFGELSRLNTDPATGSFSFGGIARFDLPTFQAAGVRAGDFTLEAASPFSPVHPQFRGQLSTATPNATGVVLQFPAATDTNGTISGLIVQPDGTTPAPAGTVVTISFGTLTVTTDASGRFQSLLPIPAGSYTVTAQLPNGLRGQTMALVPAGGNVDIQLRVLGLGAVAITVTRPTGAPVANASVDLLRATFPGDHATGTTDANGRVQFVNISEGPFSVVASEAVTGLSGRASASVLRDSTASIPVVIAGSGLVTGTFLSVTNGTPIPFAQVTLVSSGVQAYASTDTNGRFAIAAVPLGAFTVEGFDQVANRRGRTTGTLQFEGQAVDVTIVEAPRGSVAGFVVNADGTTMVPAARVSLSASSFIQTELQATALADGSFRFDGVPAGAFTLNATDPVSGFGGSAAGTLTLEGETVNKNVTLAPFGSVHVTVLDVSGQPVPNASVSIAQTCRDCGSRPGTVDTNGEVTFDHLALATYHVVARSLADDHNGGDVTVTLDSANQTAEAVVHFRGVGSVAVLVVPASGSGGVPDAEVTLNALASSGGAAPGSLTTTLTAFTDAEGLVTFPSVPVGDFSVRAEAAALAGVATGTIAAPSTTVPVQVQLGASGTVAGKFLLPDGLTAAANVFVTLRFQSQSSLQSGVLQVTTDLTGTFQFKGIPVGTFSLSAIEVVTSGVRTATGTITTDGQRVDLGTLVLDNTAPRVVSVVPAAGSANAGARGPIVVTFSEPIDGGTLNVSPAGNIALIEGTTAVPLADPTVSADGLTVTLAPTRDLTSGALEILTIRGAPDGPRDQSALVMIDPFVSSFTVRDLIPPFVVSSSPSGSAVQVPLDAVVRITFSEPVAGGTVTLRDQAGALTPGAVALTAGGTAAVFTPTDFLHANSVYTATIANVADLAGNALVGATFGTTFTTLDTIAPTIQGVQIVGAARSGATVTLHPTIADADVQRVEYTLGAAAPRVATTAPFDAQIALPAGLPSALVSAVAFDQVGNRSSPFALTIQIQPNQPPVVTLTNVGGTTTAAQGQTLAFLVHATDDDTLGQIFFSAVGSATANVVQPAAAGQSDFTQSFSVTVPANAPSNSTFSVQTAATDSAGNQSQSVSLTLNVQDAIKPTLAISSPVNNAIVVPGQNVDVVLDAADDVALASVAVVCNPVLTGCDTRTFAPVSSSHQTFTLQVPAALQAPQTVALSILATDTSGNIATASRTLQLVDTVRPVIAGLESGTGANRVAPGDTALVRATVSDNVGVTALTFSTDGGVTTSGTAAVSPAIVSGAATVSIPVPAGAPNGAALNVHVRARDAANNVSDEATFTFTIGDGAPPTLTVIEPADGASLAPGGSLTVRAHATDDVAVRRITVTTTGALAVATSQDIVPAATPADATLVIPVPADTPAGAVNLAVAAFDTSGNSSAVVTRSLTVPDMVAPTVQITSPAANAVLDPRNPIGVTVTASDAVGVTSITATANGSVTTSETRPVSPAATSRTETFTVTVAPLPAQGGALTLTATARDAAGNVSSAAAVSVQLADVVAPDVASIVPASGTTNVDPFSTVVVRFSEPMNPATLNPSTIQLLRGSTLVPAAVSIGGANDQLVLTPTAQPLAFNTVYTVSISTTAADRAGNGLVTPRTFSFTTAPPATTPPSVVTVDPANNAIDVSLAAPISVTFSQPIDPASVTPQSFRVTINGTPVAGAYSFLDGNLTARFTPADAWPVETVVATELTSAVTDRFGDALAASDGSPLASPLLFTFLTGRFSLTSPAGTDVVENSSIVLEARASSSLGVSSVLFTVNGQAQPAASGPPFTQTFTVGSAASTPTLTVVASGRDSGGQVVASDQRTFNVVVGLVVAPTLSGVPLNGTSTLRFALSSAPQSDVPITLSAGDPALVSFPTNPVIIGAGRTSVDAVVTGVSAGATAVLGTSSHGVAAAIVAVSAVQSGQTVSQVSSPVGAAVSNPPAAGQVIVQPASAETVRVTLLGAPADTDLPVSISSTDPSVATATASTIGAGQRTTDLQIVAGTNGVATLILRAGSQLVALTVFVGQPPANAAPLLLASPVGVAISNPPSAGQAVVSAGRQVILTVPVLISMSGVDTPVSVSTDNPTVATATATVVHAGDLATSITVTTLTDGVATIVVRAGAEVRAVTVFVGAPPAGSTPLLLAPPVGVSDTGLPVLGRLFAPAAANRTFAISLLATPAATDTPVTVTTSDPTVVSVAGQSVVHAGDTVANLQITTGSAGSATLTIEVAGAVRTFTIVSGDTPAPNTTPPSVAPPVGVSVVPNPALGRVISQAGAPKVAALGITLFTSPAGQATSVSVTTNNPSVATINGGASSATLVVNAGEQVLQLPIELSGAQGAALLTFEFDGQRRELVIVVGNPPASETPAVTAPVVGIQIG